MRHTVEVEVEVDLEDSSDEELIQELKDRKAISDTTSIDAPPPEALYLFLRTLPDVPSNIKDWVWNYYGRVL